LFGQDGWILASFFFCVFLDLDSVSVHEHAKKELGQYPAILTEQAWSVTHTYPSGKQIEEVLTCVFTSLKIGDLELKREYKAALSAVATSNTIASLSS